MNKLKKDLLKKELKYWEDRKESFAHAPGFYKSFICECEREIKKIKRKLGE